MLEYDSYFLISHYIIIAHYVRACVRFEVII